MKRWLLAGLGAACLIFIGRVFVVLTCASNENAKPKPSPKPVVVPSKKRAVRMLLSNPQVREGRLAEKARVPPAWSPGLEQARLRFEDILDTFDDQIASESFLSKMQRQKLYEQGNEALLRLSEQISSPEQVTEFEVARRELLKRFEQLNITLFDSDSNRGMLH